MTRSEAAKTTKTLMLLQMLGGRAKTSAVRQLAKKHDVSFNVRTYLRKLHRMGEVKTQRPFAPFDLEILWVEVQ